MVYIPIRGTSKKQPEPEKRPPADLGNAVFGVARLVQELDYIKKDITKTSAQKTAEIDAKIAEVDKTIAKAGTFTTEAIRAINEHKKQALQTIQDIKKGEPGKNADEDKIVESVLAKIPAPEKINLDDLAEVLKAKMPIQISEQALIKKVLKAIPENKASLKVITENVEIDPMAIIDKIMALPKGKFKLKTDHIDGLESTISAFRNQLARGYLHGSGLTKVIHDNTLTGDGTPESPLSVDGGADDLWVRDPATASLSPENVGDGLYIPGDVGTTPVSGAGTRLMYIPAKRGSFRAGQVEADQWDDANIGGFSFAVGLDTRATADGAFAGGFDTWAEGFLSVALGLGSHAQGDGSFAFGYNEDFTNTNNLIATQRGSIAMGSATTGFGIASLGEGSVSMGRDTQALADQAVALGRQTIASGLYSFSVGNSNTASGQASVAMGQNNIASGGSSFAMGNGATASGGNSVAFSGSATGNGATAFFGRASGNGSFAQGERADATGSNSIAMGHQGSSYYHDHSFMSMGQGSVVMGKTDYSEDMFAAGDGSFALGHKNQSNAHNSFTLGRALRVGNPMRSFTIDAGGITVTISGDVTSEFTNGNQILIQPLSPNENSSEQKQVNSVPFFDGSNTTFDLLYALDDVTTTAGYIIDPNIGTKSFAIGYNYVQLLNSRFSVGYGQEDLAVESGNVFVNSRFNILDASQTYYTTFIGGSQSGNVTYTLPVSDGSNGDVLTTDGAGNMSWTAGGGGSNFWQRDGVAFSLSPILNGDGLYIPGKNGTTPTSGSSDGTVITVAVNNGGTGYSIGNTLHLNAGNTDCQIQVTGVSGSTITSVIIIMAGTGYSLATAVTTSADFPATGTGCTIDITEIYDTATRLMWIPAKGSLYAGHIYDSSTAWDDANIGLYNAVFGQNNKVTSNQSFAYGGGPAFSGGNTITGDNSFIGGSKNVSSGDHSFTIGSNNTNAGNNSFMGGDQGVITSGFGHFVYGFGNNAVSGNNNIVLGGGNTVDGDVTFTFGVFNNNHGTTGAAVFGVSNTVATTAAESLTIGGQNHTETQGTFMSGEGNFDHYGSPNHAGNNIIGGNQNQLTSFSSFVIGSQNIIIGDSSSILGGDSNTINTGDFFEGNTVLSGSNNQITGSVSASVVGGHFSQVTADTGFAFGNRATVSGAFSAAFGSFVSISGVEGFVAGNGVTVSADNSFGFGQNFTNSTPTRFSVGFGQEDFYVENGHVTVTGKLTVVGIIDPTQVQFTQISTPSAPSAGLDSLYFKNDDRAYHQDSASNELQLAVLGGVDNISEFFNDVNYLFPAFTKDLVGRTAAVASIGTATSPNDGQNHQYQVGGYIKINTLVGFGTTVTLQVTFTDQAGASQTLSLFGQGLTTAALSGTGYYAFPEISIAVMPNTLITMKTIATIITSVNYDVGINIIKLN